MSVPKYGVNAHLMASSRATFHGVSDEQIKVPEITNHKSVTSSQHVSFALPNSDGYSDHKIRRKPVPRPMPKIDDNDLTSTSNYLATKSENSVVNFEDFSTSFTEGLSLSSFPSPEKGCSARSSSEFHESLPVQRSFGARLSARLAVGKKSINVSQISGPTNPVKHAVTIEELISANVERSTSPQVPNRKNSALNLSAEFQPLQSISPRRSSHESPATQVENSDSTMSQRLKRNAVIRKVHNAITDRRTSGMSIKIGSSSSWNPTGQLSSDSHGMHNQESLEETTAREDHNGIERGLKFNPGLQRLVGSASNSMLKAKNLFRTTQIDTPLIYDQRALDAIENNPKLQQLLVGGSSQEPLDTDRIRSMYDIDGNSLAESNNDINGGSMDNDNSLNNVNNTTDLHNEDNLINLDIEDDFIDLDIEDNSVIGNNSNSDDQSLELGLGIGEPSISLGRAGNVTSSDLFVTTSHNPNVFRAAYSSLISSRPNPIVYLRNLGSQGLLSRSNNALPVIPGKATDVAECENHGIERGPSFDPLYRFPVVMVDNDDDDVDSASYMEEPNVTSERGPRRFGNHRRHAIALATSPLKAKGMGEKGYIFDSSRATKLS